MLLLFEILSFWKHIYIYMHYQQQILNFYIIESYICLFLFHVLNPSTSSFPFLVSLFFIFFGKITLINFTSCMFSFGFKTSEALTCFLPSPSVTFICFLNALPKGEYVNLTCSINLLWSDANTSSPKVIHIYQFYLMVMLIF